MPASCDVFTHSQEEKWIDFFLTLIPWVSVVYMMKKHEKSAPARQEGERERERERERQSLLALRKRSAAADAKTGLANGYKK